ncbi:MAG: hypothetical protein ABI746_02110 [Dermatophilaceae bacterium]
MASSIRGARRSARLLGWAAAALLAGTACAEPPPTGEAGTPRTTTEATSETAAEATSGSSAGSAAAIPRWTLSVPAFAVSQLGLSDRYLAYAVVTPGASQGAARPTRVDAVDLDTKAIRTVASTTWPQGQTDLVRISGSWLLWEDLERTPSTDVSSMRWKVLAHNLADGSTRTLASSDLPSALPSLAAGAGRLAWTQASGPDAASGFAVHVFETATGASRVLASGLPPVNDLAVSAGGIYYTTADPGAASQKVWCVPGSGGPPRPVDIGGPGRGLKIGETGLASWEDATVGPARRLGIGRLGDAAAADTLAQGPTFLDLPGASNAAPGAGAVAFFDGVDHFRAVRVGLDGTLSAPIKLSRDGEALHVPCRIAAYGDEVAYCVEPDGASSGDGSGSSITVVVTSVP